jgi:hypothetical protein
LPLSAFNTDAWAVCPSCQRLIKGWVFPAMVRTQDPAGVSERVVEGVESACFNHPESRAETVCESCGRFLCRLCDIDFAGRHLCSSCIEAGKRKGRIRNLQNERMRYDLAAFSVAFLPMLFVFPTLVTAPVALVYAIWGWRRPRSLVHPARKGFLAAIVLSVLQIAGWLFFFLFVKRAGGGT